MDVELNLNTETVSHALHDKMVTVAPETTLREVFELLKQHDTGSVLICENDSLLGIFTERDALRIMAKEGDLGAEVSQHMVSPAITVLDDDTMATAVTKMASGGFRRLPIVESGRRPIGLVAVSGILRYLVEHIPEAVYTLPPGPRSVPQEREGP